MASSVARRPPRRPQVSNVSASSYSTSQSSVNNNNHLNQPTSVTNVQVSNPEGRRRRIPPSSSPLDKQARPAIKPTDPVRPSIWRWRKKKPWKYAAVSNLTWQALIVLLLAMLTGVVWNWSDRQTVDPRIKNFLQIICRSRTSSSSPSSSLAYCHSALHPTRRTHSTVRRIAAGERLLEIPRSLQIWDLDALRDAWIQKHWLLLPRNTSVAPLAASAYLALHLVQLWRHLPRQPTPWTLPSSRRTIPPALAAYLQNLPSHEDLAKFHPLLWPEVELQDRLGPYTSAYDAVQHYRHLIEQEYSTLIQAWPSSSSEAPHDPEGDIMAGVMSRTEYQRARINVMTRSFGTGPWHHHDQYHQHHHHGDWDSPAQGGDHDFKQHSVFEYDSHRFSSLQDEMKYYQINAGIDLSHGSHAMIPILDLYNHHATPHVTFAYQPITRSFVVSALRTISAGVEIMDSYGRRTDSDLFARYGFVSGDGSGWTQASLALWHKIQLPVSEQYYSSSSIASSASPVHPLEPEVTTDQLQWKQILRYLQYDDGYEKCVDVSHVDAWRLKKWKYRYLLAIANVPSRWIVMIPPRSPHSLPLDRSDRPITLDPPTFVDKSRFKFDASGVFSTCRLISLTHGDYHGEATSLLEMNWNNATWMLPPLPGDALEFRTLMCVARVASTTLSRFGDTVEEQLALVADLNRKSFQSRNWTAAHVRLGEMQTLQLLKEVAFGGLRPFQDRVNSEPAFSMRDQPCPPVTWQPLFEQVRSVISR